MRVGNKQKKVDIAVPSLSDFIHKVYINTARKIYTNIYLFERNINPLQIQKHNRELELIIREQILNTIRDNIPVEDILKVYLDETIEDDVEVEEKEEIISTEPVEEDVEAVEEEADMEEDEKNVEDTTTNHTDTKLTDDQIESMIQFNNIDEAISVDKIISEIDAPKTKDRLEQISQERNIARKLDEDDDEDEDRLVIGDKIKLTELDVHDLEKPKILNKTPLGLDEIEILT
jgi:hypothetical protein